MRHRGIAWILALMVTASALSGCSIRDSIRGLFGTAQESTVGTSEGVKPGVSVDNAGKSQLIELTNREEQDVLEIVLQSAQYITDPFSSGGNIPIYDLTRFLYERMRADGMAEGFEFSTDQRAVRVSIERIWDYAKNYFDLSNVPIDFMSQQYFDGQYMTIPNPEMVREERAYEITADKLETGPGRVTVTLSLTSGGVVYQSWTYILRPGSDGLYISSMTKKAAEYGLYAINNATAVIDRLLDVPVNARTVNSFKFAPASGGMLCWISNGKSLRIGYLDLESFSSKRYVEVAGSDQSGSNAFLVQTLGDAIAVYQSDKITILDQNLVSGTVSAPISYPSELLALCDTYTTALSISPDLGTIAFTNAKGLQYFNLSTKEARLKLANPEKTGDVQEYWEPMGFESESGLLLAKRTSQKKAIGGFVTMDTEGNYRTVTMTGTKNSLFTAQDERLMAFGATSIRRESLLENSYSEYNMVTRTSRSLTTELAFEEGERPNDGGLLLSQSRVYKTQILEVGEDLVSSIAVQSVYKELDGGETGKRTNLSFGYVDRGAAMRLRAASPSERLIAACSGLFVHAIVVI